MIPVQVADKFSKSKLKPIAKLSIQFADNKNQTQREIDLYNHKLFEKFHFGEVVLSDSYIEQFKGVEAGPLAQFIKYGIAGGLATFAHIIIFHLVAWKIFPSLQEKDFFVIILGLNVTEVNVAARSINSMLSNGVAFICSNMVAYLSTYFGYSNRAGIIELLKSDCFISYRE